MEAARQADQMAIATFESGATTVPVLSDAHLDTLFTVYDLKFGRLTGVADFDSAKPGDDGIKVYVTPIDRVGDPLKAAGAMTVELFDLAAADQLRLGHWEFPVSDAAKLWYGQALLGCYVLACPWENAPAGSAFTVRVTFVDSLTRRTFVKQKEIGAAAPVRK